MAGLLTIDRKTRDELARLHVGERFDGYAKLAKQYLASTPKSTAFLVIFEKDGATWGVMYNEPIEDDQSEYACFPVVAVPSITYQVLN